MKIAFVNLIHTRQKLAHLGEQALNWLLPRCCAGCSKENEVFCESCANASYKKGAQCLMCGFRNMDGKICYGCQSSNRIAAWQSDCLKKVLWAGPYDGALREAIWQFKYKKRKEIAAPLAKLLWKKFKEIYENGGEQKMRILEDLAQRDGVSRAIPQQRDMRVLQNTASFAIVPIPLHFKKEYERGFNQSELLAKEFSALSHFPLLTDSLLKIKETPAQVAVENKELRVKNLDGAFKVNPKLSPSNLQLLTSHTLILIDDVATTGATLFHAASALKKACPPYGGAGAKKIIGLVLAHGG